MYSLHTWILRILSSQFGIPLIHIWISLWFDYNFRTATTKYMAMYMPLSPACRSVIHPLVYKGFRCMSTSNKAVPALVYLNPDKEKELILSENKGRSGIYRWVHLESGKSYIGSAKNFHLRFKQYFNYNHISYPGRNLLIYKALLKYGYAGFKLEILEYCSLEILLQREQFYFDTFNPEYNILKVAGSPLGYRHSEAAKTLISIASKNRKVLESTRDLKRKALQGKTFDAERIERMRLSNTHRKSVLITNMETGEILKFSSLTEAGKYLGVSRVTVNKYLLNNISYKEYTITNPLLTNKESNIPDVLSNENFDSLQKPLLLTNKETGEMRKFNSITETAKYLDISRGRLWYFLNKTVKTGEETLKGYTISKIEDLIDSINPNAKKIQVTDIDTNEVTVFSSFTLAGKALGISPASISVYLGKNRTNPFRKKYIFKLV